ncbi:hypothetical protein K525DRAFT_275642 [Schizophyllum commune Loenen D]|nr:hypothetical protein K525DRAFT_275642 [Schizophyllum commune Loenen D]
MTKKLTKILSAARERRRLQAALLSITYPTTRNRHHPYHLPPAARPITPEAALQRLHPATPPPRPHHAPSGPSHPLCQCRSASSALPSGSASRARRESARAGWRTRYGDGYDDNDDNIRAPSHQQPTAGIALALVRAIGTGAFTYTSPSPYPPHFPFGYT